MCTSGPVLNLGQIQPLASATMSRSGFHRSRDEFAPHYTIQRDNSAPSARIGGPNDNNIGHVFADGSAKAMNGGSILWALPRIEPVKIGPPDYKAILRDMSKPL